MLVTAVAVAGGGLTACTGSADEAGSQPSTAPGTLDTTTAPPEGDAALLSEAVGAEQQLLSYYTVATSRSPALQRELSAQRVRQQAVVQALRDALSDPVRQATRRAAVPRERDRLLRTLGALLARAEGDREADCLAAESGPLARLLASASASHAVAGEQLRALR